ncbi:chemotaxis protein CheA [Alicyclobacillus mengziensis]|uniref:Chemotaxis protein CheA n=1 Tax=Alicyclobacillus mengziensis TaxID=2931921 RepID=A0A9X7W0E5_9BACL|nr:chemotaxis protein CheA [Alicyclobacillus mengziensis]QSO47033.1 chemotaxis protein CheA [Alicyclobacillus mengziensis]
MNEQYLDLFVDETSQHLQEMTNGLMELEQQSTNLDVIQTVFRAAHTLKGMAATMGFDRMSRLTHQMENGLDSMRHGHLEPSSAVIDALFVCVDTLEAQLQAIASSGTDVGVDETAALSALESILALPQQAASEAQLERDRPVEGKARSSHLPVSNSDVWWESLSGGVKAVAESGIPVSEVVVTMAADCPMPAVRAFMVMRDVGDGGEVLASEPPAEMIQQGECGSELRLIVATHTKPEELAASIRQMSDIHNVQVNPIEFTVAATTSDGAAVLSAGAEPALIHTGAGASTEANMRESHPSEKAASTHTEARTPSPERRPGASSSNSGRRGNHAIRVDLEKLDTLMNLFSEFVIDKTRLESIAQRRADSELADTVSHLSRIASELQDVVLKIRMVPLETVFNRFPRMVRDLAKSLDKQVRFEVSGDDTELDRTLADEIGDPLVHLIRNALDHGLESPDERVAAGKSATGDIRLFAYQARNKVYIEISDDGRGIDRGRVLQKAIRNGQISASQAAALRDEQVYDFLFQSGFSTAEKVSDISGRGVGLDVVKSKIQSLGGDVRVESTVGAGSRFIIELPLTLSIMHAMLVGVGEETYAVPLGDIAHIVRIDDTDIQRVRDMDMVVFMDKLIPLISLPALLGTGSNLTKAKNGGAALGTPMLIVRKGERLLALEVEEFVGQQEIVIKSLGTYFKTLPTGVAGATILGDGRVALILDPHAWLR